MFFTEVQETLRKTLKDPKIREPIDLYPASVAVMQEVIEHKVKLFNDDDKVKYYSLNEML